MEKKRSVKISIEHWKVLIAEGVSVDVAVGVISAVVNWQVICPSDPDAEAVLVVAVKPSKLRIVANGSAGVDCLLHWANGVGLNGRDRAEL